MTDRVELNHNKRASITTTMLKREIMPTVGISEKSKKEMEKKKVKSVCKKQFAENEIRIGLSTNQRINIMLKANR